MGHTEKRLPALVKCIFLIVQKLNLLKEKSKRSFFLSENCSSFDEVYSPVICMIYSTNFSLSLIGVHAQLTSVLSVNKLP